MIFGGKDRQHRLLLPTSSKIKNAKKQKGRWIFRAIRPIVAGLMIALSTSSLFSQEKRDTLILNGSKLEIYTALQDTTVEMFPTLKSEFGYDKFPENSIVVPMSFEKGKKDIQILLPNSEIINAYVSTKTGRYAVEKLSNLPVHDEPIYLQLDSPFGGLPQGFYALTLGEVVVSLPEARVKMTFVDEVPRWGAIRKDATLTPVWDSEWQSFCMEVYTPNWPVLFHFIPSSDPAKVKKRFLFPG